jgi:hypothetical protein
MRFLYDYPNALIPSCSKREEEDEPLNHTKRHEIRVFREG